MAQEPDPRDPAGHARRDVLRIVLQALWRQRGRTAAALILLVAAKLLMVAVPALLKRIVDVLGAPGAVTLPVFLLIAYALLRFGGGLFTELRDSVFVRVSQRAVADFTLQVFARLQRLGARFHGSRQTGTLARDVERGTAGVGFLLGTALFTLLPTLVEILSVVAILVAGYSIGFAAIVAVTFTAYFSYTFFMLQRRVAIQRRLNDLDSRASGHIVDSLLNYEAVKVNANEQAETDRLGGVLDKWVGLGVQNQYSLSRLHVGQSAIIAFGVAAVMLLAGDEVVGGRMTVGDLVLVNAYIIQICLPLNTLGLVVRQAREAFVNAERACALLRVPAEAGGGQGLPALPAGAGEIRYEGVSFGYEPGRQILWDVDFTVPAGATYAVVGGSGSGKSTLARLLFRFYDPDAGRILIGGRDIRSVDLGSLRRSLGIVPQDTILFNETIAYNIGYSVPGAARERIAEAARGARVHEFIESLPAGYETLVGERGVKLSGGERQRIAIARAILKNPPIMVFDEATSALDTRTERAIQTELEKLSRGRSALIIAHRLSTVVHADQILVMDHGRIVERGTHEELLERKGLYAQMWDLQRQQSALEAAGGRLSRQPVNLVTLVAGVLDAARELVQGKSIELFTLISAEAARITGDPGVLQQLVWDLCLHAVAVTPPGGRMEIRLARNGPLTRLSVTDGRQGQPAGEQPQWPLEPEVLRAAAAMDPAQLAARARQQGGTFHAGRDAAGGMTYSVEFPLRAVEAMPLNAAMDVPDLGQAAVMVVDDQREAREMIAEVLAAHGAQVSAFGQGGKAVAELRAAPSRDWPRVLVCDLALGDMEGYEVIGQVRALEASRGVRLGDRLPAIALSGHAGPEYRLRALLAGFQVHIAKPVDPRELCASVAALLRQPPG